MVIATFVEAGDPPVLVRLEITSSASGQKEASRKLGKYLKEAASGIDTEAIIDQVLTQSQERIDQEAATPSDDEMPTVREMVEQVVPELFDLRYRLPDGSAWSEKWGRAVKRPEFISHTPASLMDRCSHASDAPADETSGLVDETRLHRQVETALKILWASLIADLPAQAADAGLSEATADAKQFVAAITELWVTLTTHESTTTIDAKGNE